MLQPRAKVVELDQRTRKVDDPSLPVRRGVRSGRGNGGVCAKKTDEVEQGEELMWMPWWMLKGSWKGMGREWVAKMIDWWRLGWNALYVPFERVAVEGDDPVQVQRPPVEMIAVDVKGHFEPELSVSEARDQGRMWMLPSLALRYHLLRMLPLRPGCELHVNGKGNSPRGIPPSP